MKIRQSQNGMNEDGNEREISLLFFWLMTRNFLNLVARVTGSVFSNIVRMWYICMCQLANCYYICLQVCYFSLGFFLILYFMTNQPIKHLALLLGWPAIGRTVNEIDSFVITYVLKIGEDKALEFWAVAVL